MKKLLLLALGLCLTISNLYSQNDNHLQFRGISISGNLESVIKQLENIDYNSVGKDNENAILKGRFANKSCELFVFGTPRTKHVYMIVVAFEKTDSWYSLKSQYEELKSQLKEKYNKNPKSTETFIDPYYEGDGYEMSALSRDKCVYVSRFYLENGEISLMIRKNQVLLYYKDKIGEEINEKEEKANAFNDL